VRVENDETLTTEGRNDVVEVEIVIAAAAMIATIDTETTIGVAVAEKNAMIEMGVPEAQGHAIETTGAVRVTGMTGTNGHVTGMKGASEIMTQKIRNDQLPVEVVFAGAVPNVVIAVTEIVMVIGMEKVMPTLMAGALVRTRKKETDQCMRCMQSRRKQRSSAKKSRCDG
jgi:hypothetical protein